MRERHVARDAQADATATRLGGEERREHLGGARFLPIVPSLHQSGDGWMLVPDNGE